jgi:hypothetical protein
MAQVSGTNEMFLTQEFAVQKIFELMNPYLHFLDLVEPVKSTSRSVQYKKETVSDASDTEKRLPRKRTASAKWTYVDITPMTVDSALLSKEGFAVRIDEDAIDYVEGVDEIKRAYRKVAYWLGEAMNNKAGAAMTAGATTPTWTPAAVWSDAGAKPVEDLRKLKYCMKKEGYAYRLTDILLNDTNMEELEGYLASFVTNDSKQTSVYGNPVVSNDKIEIPIVGTVRSLMSAITEGYVLALDRNNPGTTLYYNNSARYSTDTITYRGPDGSWKTVPNFGFNVKTFTENESHDTVIQVWMDSTFVVKEPYALLYDNGI